jgi:hypothetical protein
MAAYPQEIAAAASAASGFTLIKWIFIYGSFLVYFVSLIFYLLSTFRIKK